MKLTFLGSGAAEGIPSPFCNCRTCDYARAAKGRNVRRRQAVLINDDLMIDFGPDIYISLEQTGLSMIPVQYLLVTHSHSDHFYAGNLDFRPQAFRRSTTLPALKLIGGPSVQTLWTMHTSGDGEKQDIVRHPILPGDRLSLSPYEIQAIQARHLLDIGDAMNYIIEDGAHRLLYATDTGLYDESSWQHIERERMDMVVMEMTYGLQAGSEIHLGIGEYMEMRRRLTELGCIDDTTLCIAAHFSHQDTPPHDELEQQLLEHNIIAAYDGLIVEIG